MVADRNRRRSLEPAPVVVVWIAAVLMNIPQLEAQKPGSDPVSIAGSEPEAVQFNRDIRPILTDSCLHCHGPDSLHREADLRLDEEDSATRDRDGYRVIDRRHPAAGELWKRITSRDASIQMPPPGSGRRLTAEQKAVLQNWLRQGAPWQAHWSFVAPIRPPVPELMEDRWSRNAIDRFVLRRLRSQQLQPAVEAAPETLLRRVTLDLTGLPPTVDDMDAFLADTRPGAYERLVDLLLSSPRYGEAMALPWLDAARYADTDGYQNDGPRTMWRWRDWVIEACNAGMPFDQFTIEQLAGDLLPAPTLEQRIATGFNRNHRYNSEAGLVLDEFLFENAVDRVDTTSTVWMGLTMGCARCHDHKYDPLSQRDYYQLIALFDKVSESGRAVKFGNSEPWVIAPTREQQTVLAEHDRQLTTLQAQIQQQQVDVDDAIDRMLNNGPEPAAALNSGRPLIARGLVGRFALDSFESGDPAVEQATTSNGAATFADGVFRNALACDGRTRFPVGKAGHFHCESRFSVSFWLRPASIDTGVVLSRQDNNTRRPGLAVELNQGHVRFFLITRWVAGVAAVETEATVPVDEWTHVTLTNDGSQSARGMLIYLDGELQPTRILYNTNSNTGGASAQSQLVVGGGIVGAGYRGLVDELRVYDRTLWSDEIELLACGVPVDEIVRRPSAERTQLERAVLRRWCLEHLLPAAVSQSWQQFEAARAERQRFLDSLPTSMVMEDVREPAATHVRIRGVYDQLGDVVSPAAPSALHGRSSPQLSNRLEFARWLMSAEHPLTARVAVNRYWQHFLGVGLVKTAEDFGVQGEPPSHPELLDWLALEFRESGWDSKHLHRLIVTSATYRQTSSLDDELQNRDPNNRLLARGPRRRLSAHAIRDQALAVSGLLVEQLGGPSVNPYQPAGLWAEMSNMKYKQSRGRDLYRRSLYTFWKRTVAPPALAVLDAADRESCMVRTQRTNTPLQALTTLNEQAYVEAARHLAQTLMLSGEDVVVQGFCRVTARYPDERERQVLTRALDEYRRQFRANPAAARKLLSVGESPAPHNQDPLELAAITVLANVLLNLDESITKE